MEKEFNIRHAFIIGIALERKCADVINEIYYANEKLYHEAYLNEGLSEDLLKRTFTMETEDRINKMSGIIQVCYQKNDFLLIEKIIKKCHPSIVNYVKKSRVINLDEFSEKYQINSLSETEVYSILVSLMYLSVRKGKTIEESASPVQFILGKWDSLLDPLRCDYKLMLENNMGEYSTQVLEDIEIGYKMFDYSNNFKNKLDNNLEDFISNHLEHETYKRLGVFNYKFLDERKKFEVSKKIFIDDYIKARNEVFTSGIGKYIGSLSRFLKTLGLNEGDIFIDTPLDKDAFENIMANYSYAKTDNNVKEEDRELFVVSCIFIYNFAVLYKKCKDMYLNKLLEDKHKEAIELEKEINLKREKYESKLEEYKSKINEVNNENKELKRRIKELERENAKLSGEASKTVEKIDSLNELNTELKSTIEELKHQCENLSEIAFTTTSEDISTEDKIEYINKFKIGIFGGMSNIKSLSGNLKNTAFYNSKNQDISSVLGLDMIFISYEFFNHAFSKKVKSVIENSDIPLRYISGTNNNLIIDTIYQELVNYEDKK